MGKENGRSKPMGQATEATSPAAFSDWTQRLRFDRSFTAKLILSDEAVKGYYADIASALLRYERVRSHMGWSGVTFSFARERLAWIAITGKTLCLYLALSPADLEASRYKPRDVSSVKKHAKTPSLLRIRSTGAKTYAIRLIEELATRLGLTLAADATVVSVSAFKTDSFQNLVTRGLIRILRGTAAIDASDEPRGANGRGGAYADTADTMDALLGRHGLYDGIRAALVEGETSAALTKRQMLRAVDEIWVKAIEDCIPSLDELIRNPNHYIAETEEILPIERTKRISGRSIAHLGRHTDYISVGADGEITPTRMLNVFREDSLLTYENKFLNTLIARLYAFVTRRYEVARIYGADETVENFTFESRFTHGAGRANVRISVEYAEKRQPSDAPNVLAGTGLWRRVERLSDIVSGYMHAPFVKAMENRYVHPPILRTNAIVKNKYFRECLALWEFIESYDDAGYGITVEEKSMALSDAYVREAYNTAAVQYLLFRHHADLGFDEGEPTEIEQLRPDYALTEGEPKPHREAFVDDRRDLAETGDLTLALLVAMEADEQMPDADDAVGSHLRKTFHARIRLADEDVKSRYADMANALLRYRRVKLRESRRFATFSVGRQPLARIIVSGKTLRLYLALQAAEVAPRYHAADVSDKRVFVETPLCVRVKSRRSLQYAIELIGSLAETFGLTPIEDFTPVICATDYAAEPLADMLEKGWIAFVGRRQAFADASAPRGSAKTPTVAARAADVEALAVQAGETPLPALRQTEESPFMPTARGARLAREIDGLVRPTSSYEDPTVYGVDDVSGFMDDSLLVTGDDGEEA